MNIFDRADTPSFSDIIEIQQDILKSYTDDNFKVKDERYLSISSYIVYVYALNNPFGKTYKTNYKGWRLYYSVDLKTDVHSLFRFYPTTEAEIDLPELLESVMNIAQEYNIKLKVIYIPYIDSLKEKFFCQETEATEIEHFFDNSLITLSGKKFKEMRKQLNKLETDIADGKIRIERVRLKDINKDKIKDISYLVKKWTEQKKAQGADNIGFNGILTNSTTFWRKCNEFYNAPENAHLTNNISGVFIYDNKTDKLICYGIDELGYKGLGLMVEGKLDYEYSKIYPDLNKVINHYEAKHLVETFNVNPDYMRFTLLGEYLHKTGYISFKNSVAHNVSYLKGNLLQTGAGFIVYKYGRIKNINKLNSTNTQLKKATIF